MIAIVDDIQDRDAFLISIMTDENPKNNSATAIALAFVDAHQARNYRHIPRKEA